MYTYITEVSVKITTVIWLSKRSTLTLTDLMLEVNPLVNSSYDLRA